MRMTGPCLRFTHSTWTAFHQSLCAPPATRIQPSQPHAPQLSLFFPPPVDARNAAITQAEMERAVPNLSNGKPAGKAG